MNRVFIDANVLIDYFFIRANQTDKLRARMVIEYCFEYCQKAFISTHSFLILYHFIKKKFVEVAVLKEKFKEAFELFRIAMVETSDIFFALESMMSDFEDAVQLSCAAKSGADYIITKNINDYYGPGIPYVIRPSQFFHFF